MIFMRINIFFHSLLSCQLNKLKTITRLCPATFSHKKPPKNIQAMPLSCALTRCKYSYSASNIQISTPTNQALDKEWHTTKKSPVAWHPHMRLQTISVPCGNCHPHHLLSCPRQVCARSKFNYKIGKQKYLSILQQIKEQTITLQSYLLLQWLLPFLLLAAIKQ